MKKKVMKGWMLMLWSAAGICIAAQAVAAKERPVPRKPAVIAFFGDSTIRGYRSHSGEQVAVPTPQAFAEALASSAYVVRNEGADSSRVEHLLAGTDGRHPSWAEYLPASGVDIVITNHASKNGNPVSMYKADMRTMLRLARQNGKRVILMTPSPIAEGGLEPYVEAMRELAAEEAVPLIDVYRYLQDYMADRGRTVADLIPDGYHPADEVYIQVGQYAAREFRKINRQRGKKRD